MELRGKQEEDDQPIYEEEGIWAMNEDQALTLTLSTLLHPSVFSCVFSDVWERRQLNRWRGLGFVGRDEKDMEKNWARLQYGLFFAIKTCVIYIFVTRYPNDM